MSERWDCAVLFAASMEVLRAVGGGGSVAGKEGTTVRWAVAGDAALGGEGADRAEVLLVLADAGLAGVDVVEMVARADLVVAKADERGDGVKVREWGIRYARGAALLHELDRRIEKPRQVGVAVMAIF